MIGIYKIINPKNKIYIGQTINYEKRIQTYKKLNCKGQIKLYRSFLKYGIENHQFLFIEYCTIDKLNIRERYWQEQYDVISNKGLNCILTSTEYKRKIYTKEIKDKISIGNIGKKRSKSVKQKISIAMTNRIISEKTKLKISNSRKGMIFSQETKKKMSEKKQKLILDKSLGIFYNCVKDASIAYNINISTLTQKLNGNLNNNTNLIYI